MEILADIRKGLAVTFVTWLLVGASLLATDPQILLPVI